MGHFQPTSASAGCSGFWLFSAWPSSPWASLKLKPRQLPIQRLILIFCMEATTVLDIITEATMATLTTATTARDLLKLSLLLLLTPRLKLTPGMDIMVDMVSDTMVDTTVDTMATPTTDTTARGLLMPRLPLLLQLTPRPTPGWCIDTTVLVATTVATTVATLTTAITARDLLMLSLLLPLRLMPRLIPGMDTTVDTTTVATHTMAMVTAMATTGANKKGTSIAGLTGMKCQQFLTTTCPMFSISEKNQNVQNKTSSFFKHTAFKHLYILYIGTYAYLLRPLEPQERTKNVWF